MSIGRSVAKAFFCLFIFVSSIYGGFGTPNSDGYHELPGDLQSLVKRTYDYRPLTKEEKESAVSVLMEGGKHRFKYVQCESMKLARQLYIYGWLSDDDINQVMQNVERCKPLQASKIYTFSVDQKALFLKSEIKDLVKIYSADKESSLHNYTDVLRMRRVFELILQPDLCFLSNDASMLLKTLQKFSESHFDIIGEYREDLEFSRIRCSPDAVEQILDIVIPPSDLGNADIVEWEKELRHHYSNREIDFFFRELARHSSDEKLLPAIEYSIGKVIPAYKPDERNIRLEFASDNIVLRGYMLLYRALKNDPSLYPMIAVEDGRLQGIPPDAKLKQSEKYLMEHPGEYEALKRRSCALFYYVDEAAGLKMLMKAIRLSKTKGEMDSAKVNLAILLSKAKSNEVREIYASTFKKELFINADDISEERIIFLNKKIEELPKLKANNEYD